MKTTAVVACRGLVLGSLGRAAAAMALGASGLFLPWQETQRVTSRDGALGDAFGVSVALDGNRSLIGADQATWGPGSAYVFLRSGAL